MTIPNNAVKLAAQAIAETFNTFAGTLATGEDAGSTADDWMQEACAALEAAVPAILAAERERVAQAIGALSELKLRDYPGSGPHVSKWAAIDIARGES